MSSHRARLLARTALVPLISLAALVPLGCAEPPAAPAPEESAAKGRDGPDVDPPDRGAQDPGDDSIDVGGADGGAAAGEGGADPDEPVGGGGVVACGSGEVLGCSGDGAHDFTCTLQHDGRERRYLLHVPASYADRPATGAPIVFGFHGLRTTAALQEYVSGMKADADARGYVLVHPEGVGGATDQSWNAGACCGAASAEGVDDVGFTTATLERIAEGLCIDPKRVYAAGFSNGGHMAYRLACEQADVFAAVASVAGVTATTSCAPSRAVPVLHFHGTSDAIVSYDIGIDGLHGAVRVVADWAERNGCAATTTTMFTNGDVTCAAHDGCASGAAAELCTIEGGGHQWPGGSSIPFLGPSTSDVSATEAIGAFFASHALP